MKTILRAPVLAILSLLVFSNQTLGADQKNKRQGEPVTEDKIIKEVRHELLLLPYYSVFDFLSFRVSGDTVTLQGQVVRPTLKSDAEAAVRRVEGVRNVANNIEVLPLSPMDTQLRHAVFRAIYGDPNLSRYAWSALPPIHIIVKNGNITLEGVVDSSGDKNLAGLRASGVPNGFSVKNDLAVENQKK